MTNGTDTKTLEHRVADLENQVSQLNMELLGTQLDDWKARIDQLEVQAHLGQLEARQQITPLVDQLRNRWLDAREAVANTQDAAGDALSTLRDGVRSAMKDLSDAFDEAVQRLKATER